MSVDDSRKIRDELFSLTSINKKSVLTKDKISELTKNKEILELTIENNNKTHDETKESIETTKKDIDNDSDIKIKKYTDIIASCDKDILLYDEEKKSVENKLKIYNGYIDIYVGRDLKSKTDELELRLTDTTNKIDNIKDNIKDEKDSLEIIITNDKILFKKQKTKELKENESKLEETTDSIKQIKRKIIEHNEHNDYVAYTILCDEQEELIKKINSNTIILDKNKEELLKLKENKESLKARALLLKRDIDILKLGEKCPTCDSDLKKDEDKLKNTIAVYNKVYDEYNDKTKELSTLEILNKSLESEQTIYIDNSSKNQKKLEEIGEISDVYYDKSITLEELEEKLTLEEKSETKLKTDIEYTNKQLLEYSDIKEEDYKEIDNDKEIIENRIKDLESDLDTMNTLKGELSTLISLNNNKLIGFVDTEEDLVEKSICLTKISEFENELKTIKENISIKEEEKSNNEALLDEQKNKKTDDVLKKLTESVENINKRIANDKNALNLVLLEIEKYEALKYVYSENGLKKWLLNKSKNDFSKKINHDLLKFNMSVKFDDSFSISIYKGGKDLDSKLMSVGQRKIVDTIICINFIELYLTKIRDINFCILDECLSNLSKKNSELLLSIIYDKLIPRGFNVKLTNHAPISQHIFNKSIKLEDKLSYTDVTITQ
jgi:DNA repair exonuclease SbcCD ATPase subunit